MVDDLYHHLLGSLLLSTEEVMFVKTKPLPDRPDMVKSCVKLDNGATYRVYKPSTEDISVEGTKRSEKPVDLSEGYIRLDTTKS